MRFLHTADWHLGRIFHGVHLTEDQAYILEQFIALVADTRPDVVVIAGDIYDRAVPPIEAVELLNNVLGKILLDYKTPIIMIAGNHDSPERLGFGSQLLAKQGLYVTGTLQENLTPIVLNDEHGPVYFAPLTYAEPAIVRQKLAAECVNHETALQVMISKILKNTPVNSRTVAIAHAFIGGSLESQSERPLSVGGSSMVGAEVFAPFCYTALGHLHNSQQAGAPNVRYAGSLLKYSFDEAKQQKGINLVELDAAGNSTVECISLSPLRDIRCIEGYLKDILNTAQTSDDYIQVTLLDKEPILDIMGKLRQVYSNVLHIERPYFNSGGTISGPQADHRKLSERVLFASFFEQMTGQKLSALQEREFAAVLEDISLQNREVKA